MTKATINQTAAPAPSLLSVAGLLISVDFLLPASLAPAEPTMPPNNVL
jgi:hypothetical protein